MKMTRNNSVPKDKKQGSKGFLPPRQQSKKGQERGGEGEYEEEAKEAERKNGHPLCPVNNNNNKCPMAPMPNMKK